MKNELIKPLKAIYRFLYPSRKSASPLEVEKAEQIFYINYLQEGMTVFDVGANIGEFSLLFSRLVGQQGQVHAFEASQNTFNKLKTICEIANRQRIILNHQAVSDQPGIVKLYTYDDAHSGWNSLANRPLEQYGIYDVKPTHLEEIEAVTIDDYCKKNNISQIDLLKIDVEGAEYQVLLGSHKMLENHKINCCVFEFGQTTFDMGNSPNEIENYLRELGYSISNVVGGNSIFPGRSQVQKAQFSVHVARPIK